MRATRPNQNVTVAEQAPNKTGTIDFFLRHVVAVYLLFEDKNGKQHPSVFTGFVMSIEGVWFLMTAGHCIEGVDAAKARGWCVKCAKLFDALRSDAQHKMPIPFDFEGAGAAKICSDGTYDYGGIVLDDHYRRLLEANGVVPITEEAWKKQPKRFDFFKVIGVNYAGTQFTPTHAHIKVTFHRVRKLRRRPSGFQTTKAPTLWGKISLDEAGTSIEGLSGGPVYGFVEKEDGELKYWLHAVQSRWLEKKRLIAACKMRPLGRFLKEFMHGKHRDLVTPAEVRPEQGISA